MLPHCRPLRVLLVEDDLQFRTVIGNAIDSEPAFHLTAVSSSKREALQTIQERSLDIVLVGLKLPDGSVIELIEATHRRHPAPDVLVIGTLNDQELILSCIKAGAAGCLLREALLCRGGEFRLNPMIAGLLIGRVPQNSHAPHKLARPEDAQVGGLSAVEREILRCLSGGLSNKEIARSLILSTYNVDYHLKKLRQRFSVRNRVQLVSAAMALPQHLLLSKESRVAALKRRRESRVRHCAGGAE